MGTFYSSNLSFQWRFPIALACVPPLALLACSPWIPESPRWCTSEPTICSCEIFNFLPVLTRGRKEEAWAIVTKLHGDETEESRRFAREEFYQMTQQVQADASAWVQGGNRQLFSKPSYRKRMWMGFFIQYAAQSTGAQVIYGRCSKCHHHRYNVNLERLIFRSLYCLVISEPGTHGRNSFDPRGCLRNSSYSF